MPRIAFLTAGGIAPCLSASIGALIGRYRQIAPDAEFIGYRNGYQGLLRGTFIQFPQSVVEKHELFYRYGGSPIGNSRVKLTNLKDCVKRGLVREGQDPLAVAANNRSPSAKFLPEADGNGVLQMGAPHLDYAVEFLLLFG